MSKRISVDLDEIIRNTWIQFDKLYVSEFGMEGVPENPYVYDYFNNYKWEGGVEVINVLKEDIPEDLSPKDYKLNENGESNADPFLFKKEEKEYTALDQYNKFMYEDYVFEIFGAAPQMYKGIDLDLNSFIQTFGNSNITIVSKENIFSIPPTLFFLSKTPSRFRNYKFYDKFDQYWDDCDVLITTNPYLLKNKPENKEIIKLKRPYNSDIECENECIQLIDIVNDEKLKKILE
ncbi:MAG: hypothetical protein ACOC2W_01660 [bacterium]